MAPVSAETIDPEARDARRERILDAVRAVPRGVVVGYATIARRAGLPRHARLVARVLAQADDPTLPWHRVLRSDGRIGFPEGSPMWHRQVGLLRGEGVRVHRGRVRIEAGEDALDAALWGPPID